MLFSYPDVGVPEQLGHRQDGLEMMSGFELDVMLVSYGTPSHATLKMAKDSD